LVTFSKIHTLWNEINARKADKWWICLENMPRYVEAERQTMGLIIST
jgi:hypothetical protein